MSEYHHGDLPRQLLAEAAVMAADAGPGAITLRELARRTGVSHSAPVHHFGTLRRLLTALATTGFEALNEVLCAHTDDIYEMGVAYVGWALEHPGHYAVMWQPRLLDDADATLRRSRDQAWTLLSSAVRTGPHDDGRPARIDAYAAFAVVHGLAGIWLSGALPIPDEPEALTREITRKLALSTDRRPPWPETLR